MGGAGGTRASQALLHSPVGAQPPRRAAPRTRAGTGPVWGAEELVLPHLHEGAGSGLLGVLHPGFTAAADAGWWCPPSGGSFSQSHPFCHQFSVLRDNS